ncbi:MAG: hypothetical protein MJK11_09080 [Pseudomonadales bacterium]|nr:hypothetical protein [Pseudomonadales bacterium]
MILPEGWFSADNEDKKRLGNELKIELITGHKLYSKKIEIVAHRDDATDDVLCKHIDENDSYSVVHLTWCMKPEIDIKHPLVVMQGSFEDFLAYEAKWL